MMTPDEGGVFAGEVLRDLAIHTVLSSAEAMRRMHEEGLVGKDQLSNSRMSTEAIKNGIMLGITLAVDKPEWAHALVTGIDAWVEDDFKTRENHQGFSQEFVESHSISMETPQPLSERGGEDELPDVNEILKDFRVGQEDQPET